MRLSDILNKDKSSLPKSPATPVTTPKPEKAPPPPLKSAKPPESKSQSLSPKETKESVPLPPPEPTPKEPETDLTQIKQEMRESLEEEFKEKMAKIDRAKKELEEKEIEATEREKKALEESLKVEEDQLQKKTEEATGENFGSILEEQKQKIEELKTALKVKEEEAKLKGEKLEQEREARKEQERQVEDQINAAQETAVAEVAMSEVQERQNRYQQMKVQQATQTQLHAVYDCLVQVGGRLLEDISAKKSVDFSLFRAEISKAIEMATKHEGILVGISLQPYVGEDYFAYHAANSMILSLAIGMEMKISKEYLMDLSLASFFHDIALRDVRDDLDYPKELSGEMKKHILEHPYKSAEIMRSWLSDEAIEGIQNHHETSDGQGYPKKLKQKEISLFGKIINVVDSFEAMTHARPYRPKPFPVSEAMKQMIEIGKHSYDREVLKALMAQVGFYPVMCLVELSNKQIARVIRQNKKHPLSPVVKVEFDEWGHKLRKPVMIDLTESKLIHVTGTLEEVESYQTRLVSKRNEKQSFLVILLVRILPFFLILATLCVAAYIVIKI